MRKIYLTDTFCLDALGMKMDSTIEVHPLREGVIQAVLADTEHYEIVSAVGCTSSARIFSGVLGIDIRQGRLSIEFGPGDQLIVGQYRGPRLEAGATELPPGATITWALVTIL